MIDRKQISGLYIGKRVNSSHFTALFRANGSYMGNDMYIAYCPSYDKEMRVKFGITDLLYASWEYRGIDFRVNVYTKNGIVADCDILKYKEGGGGHGRPSGHYLIPTQQELRIFRRVMDYITE